MLTENTENKKVNRKTFFFLTQIIVLGIPEKYNHMGLFCDFVCLFYFSRGLFHKTSLPNKPGLIKLVSHIVSWFGSK